jgi:hypothetical protein
MINTVTLKTATGSGASQVLIDGPTNRRTVRSGELSYDSVTYQSSVVIAHQDSNENPGFKTQRTNIRLNILADVPDSDKQVNGYVQATMSFPKDVIPREHAIQIATALINFLLFGETPGDSDVILATDVIADAANAGIARLYNGEP